MSYETSIVVRYGHLSLNPGQPDKPTIYARLRRVRPLRWEWALTCGCTGRTFTRGGAIVAAHAAAWRAES